MAIDNVNNLKLEIKSLCKNISDGDVDLAGINLRKIFSYASFADENLRKKIISRIYETLEPIQISDEEIVQHVDQILNLDDNTKNDMAKVKMLFRTYGEVLKDLVTPEFAVSLINSETYLHSIKNIDEETTVTNYAGDGVLEGLKNRADSFLIVPIYSGAPAHALAAVIRKTDEGYSATCVNRLEEGNNQYREYLFSNSKKKNLTNLLNTYRLFNRESIRDLYNDFASQSDNHFNLNITSREQVLGNCFIKEPESALQFAFSTSNFKKEDFEKLRVGKLTFKPKWLPNTLKMREKYVGFLTNKYPDVQKLLSIQLNQYLEEKENRKIVSPARKGEKESVQKLLANNVNINGQDASRRSALFWAIKNSHLNTAETLLKNNADKDLQGPDDETPLFYVSKQGNIEAVKLLLKYSASTNIPNKFDETPLHAASEGGHFEIARELLKFGADIDKKNCIGYTPLMNATSNNKHEVMELLINSNAKLDVQDCQGRTALMIATENSSSKEVELLVKAGAKTDIKDSNNKKAIDYAKDIKTKFLIKGRDTNLTRGI